MSSSHSSAPDWEPPSPEDLQRMLPQYEITGIIGRGGMGAVYKGRQAKLNRAVAIKLLPETFSQGADEMNFAKRFEQEAQAMANLDHPAIISVYDFGETPDGQLYFVMEFVDGMDIHQYLHHHGGKLPQEQAVNITAHVLDALAYAHDHGIVHRDIKPANILLNREGRVKIADFGLAKKSGPGTSDTTSPLTITNMAMGTPDFVAPEALDFSKVPDHRADLYAVGVMLYQMLTGKLPRGHFKLPSQIASDLDPRLDQIVSRALQTDPDDRYANAAAVRTDLDRILTQPLAHVDAGQDSGRVPAVVPLTPTVAKGGPGAGKPAPRLVVPKPEAKPAAGTSRPASAKPQPVVPSAAARPTSKVPLYAFAGVGGLILLAWLIISLTGGKKEPPLAVTPTTSKSETSVSGSSLARKTPGPGGISQTGTTPPAQPPKPETRPTPSAPEPPAAGPSGPLQQPSGRTVDLLALVDVAKDGVSGGWSKQPDGVAVKASRAARLQLPYAPPQEYDFLLDFTVTKGSPDVAQILCAGDRDFVWKMGAAPYGNEPAHQDWFGFEMVDGQFFRTNKTKTITPWKLENGVRHSAVLAVRKDGVTATVNGKQVIQFKTDFKNVSIQTTLRLKDPRLLGFAAWDCDVTFHRAEVREVSGQGNLMRSAPSSSAGSPLVSIPGFTTRLEGYHTARRTQFGELATKYLRGLDVRLNQSADAGDLKVATAFAEEKTRVEALLKIIPAAPADPLTAVADKTFTLAELPPGAPEALVSLRQTWTTESEKIQSSLGAALLQSLQALESELNKSGNLDQSQAVLAYRESLAAGGSENVATNTETPSTTGTPVGSPTTPASEAPDAVLAEIPRPDGKEADMSKPVQVYLLLGQSNMVGLGEIASLEEAVKTKNKYGYLVDDAGNWIERKDVRNVFIMSLKLQHNDWMSVNNRKNLGPEFGIGHTLGNAVDAPVMILKSCIGNRSLGWDLLPPGSEPWEFEGKTIPGYRGTPSNPQGNGEKVEGEWYAGKQYDDDVEGAKQILADLNTYYPGAKSYEIAGFFFWQGEKDSGNAPDSERYEFNLVNFIKQLRKDFDAPNAKFVMATLGEATKEEGGNKGKVTQAQLAVDGSTGKYPEFKGNVATVFANPFSKGGSGNSHYDGNAETYLDVGEAMGHAMVELLAP